VDEALLTGESRPLLRRKGEGVIAGSHNLTGVVLVRVERTGAQTRYAAIVGGRGLVVAQRPGSRNRRGRGGADRHLPLCPVAGDAGGHAGGRRRAGPARRAGAPAAGAGRLRLDRYDLL